MRCAMLFCDGFSHTDDLGEFSMEHSMIMDIFILTGAF